MMQYVMHPAIEIGGTDIQFELLCSCKGKSPYFLSLCHLANHPPSLSVLSLLYMPSMPCHFLITSSSSSKVRLKYDRSNVGVLSFSSSTVMVIWTIDDLPPPSSVASTLNEWDDCISRSKLPGYACVYIICNYQNVNICFYSMIVSEHIVQHVHMYKEVSVALTVMHLPVLHATYRSICDSVPSCLW